LCIGLEKTDVSHRRKQLRFGIYVVELVRGVEDVK
jgi:hypothetical protein